LVAVSFVYTAAVLFGLQDFAWDEAHYLKIAEYWYDRNPAFKELFMEPVPHSRVLNFSPLLSFLEYMSFLAFGMNLEVPKLLYATFLPLLLVAVYKLVSEVDSREVALTACGFLLTNATILFWSTRMYTDIPAVALMSLGFYFVVKAGKSDARRNYVAAGVAFGLGAMMRVPSVAIAGAAVLLYMVLNRKLSPNILFMSTIVLPAIPWLVYSQMEFENAFDGLETYFVQFAVQPKEPAKSSASIAAGVDVVWMLMAAIGVFVIGRAADIRVVAAAVAFVVFLATPFGDVRYAIPAIVFGSMVAAAGAYRISNGSPLRITLLIVIVFLVLLNIPTLAQRQMDNLFCANGSAVVKIAERLRSTENDSIVLAESYWPQIEFYSKRDTYALVGEAPHLDMLARDGRTGYIITLSENPNIKYLNGFRLLETFTDNCRTLYLYGR